VSAPGIVQRITQRRGVRQLVKFGIVGTSGLAVNVVIFTILQKMVPNHAAPFQYNLIYSISFLSGGVSNYFLNRIWTFRSTGHAGKEGAAFLTVSVIALLVGLVVSTAFAPLLGRGHKLWLLATLAGIFVNFFINKYWTFRAVR